jgi:hypothetical protein
MSRKNYLSLRRPRPRPIKAEPGLDYDTALLPSSWRDRRTFDNDAAVENAQEQAYEDNEARRIGLI